MKTLFNIFLLVIVIYFVFDVEQERFNNVELTLTKNEYIHTFKQFIKYVDREKYTFSNNQWRELDKRYRLYAHGYYDYYHHDLSKNEREFIILLRKAYHISRSKRVAIDFAEKLENLWLKVSLNYE